MPALTSSHGATPATPDRQAHRSANRRIRGDGEPGAGTRRPVTTERPGTGRAVEPLSARASRQAHPCRYQEARPDRLCGHRITILVRSIAISVSAGSSSHVCIASVPGSPQASWSASDRSSPGPTRPRPTARLSASSRPVCSNGLTPSAREGGDRRADGHEGARALDQFLIGRDPGPCGRHYVLSGRGLAIEGFCQQGSLDDELCYAGSDRAATAGERRGLAAEHGRVLVDGLPCPLRGLGVRVAQNRVTASLASNSAEDGCLSHTAA